MMKDMNVMPVHRLELTGREHLLISGVEDVERFDETGIVMSTSAGMLVVTGENLHIGKLSLDGGELHVDGRIDAVTYEEETASAAGGGFLRGGNRLPRRLLQPPFWLIWPRGGCFFSPSCWGPPARWAMIFCAPSASAFAASPRFWMCCSPWGWEQRPSPFCCGGRKGNYGGFW